MKPRFHKKFYKLVLWFLRRGALNPHTRVFEEDIPEDLMDPLEEGLKLGFIKEYVNGFYLDYAYFRSIFEKVVSRNMFYRAIIITIITLIPLILVAYILCSLFSWSIMAKFLFVSIVSLVYIGICVNTYLKKLKEFRCVIK